MNNDNNIAVGSVSCDVVSGTNKNGKKFEAIQFAIMTEKGWYKSSLNFPSSLEHDLVIDAINAA